MDDASPTWVSIPRAARVLGTGERAVRTLIRRGLLTSRAVPGSYPRVLLVEVQRLAEATTTPARSG